MTKDDARYCVCARSSAWQRCGQIALTGALLLLSGCGYGQKIIVVKDKGWGGKQYAMVDVWQDTKTLKYYYTHPDTGKRIFVTSDSPYLSFDQNFDNDNRPYISSDGRVYGGDEGDNKH